MLTLSLISQKGGAGKTTLACGLAVVAEGRGMPAVVIDLDPQGSAGTWAELRDADVPVVATAHAARLGAVLGAARDAGAGVVLIDTAPHAAEGALAAARASDGVLIPCRPAAADLHAIASSLDVVRIAGRPAAVVVNAAQVRSPLIAQSLEALAGYGAEIASVVVHQRADHIKAFAAGLAASEYEGDGKAAAELVALFEWVMSWRNQK